MLPKRNQQQNKLIRFQVLASKPLWYQKYDAFIATLRSNNEWLFQEVLEKNVQ